VEWDREGEGKGKGREEVRIQVSRKFQSVFVISDTTKRDEM